MFRSFATISIVILSLYAVSPLSAQNQPAGGEVTWSDALASQRSEVAPQKLELLSIQVSKLPRDTFGHGEPPGGGGFVSSFVAASGTGIYGLFELAPEGDLKFQEALSSLVKFTDDSGQDLTENPGDEKVNEFFDLNKKLSVNLSHDQTKVLFTLRGYSTPKTGAQSLKAEAKITFLSLSREKSATVQTKLFGTSEPIEIGPVSFRVAKNAGGNVTPRGRTRFSGKKDWALLVKARQLPVKSIEVLDAQGDVIWKASGLAFDGKSYTQFMEHPESLPAAVRATWYEKWELITVPIQIETPLGI